MEIGRYKIPREIQDEDKWFRFFTKKQLAVIAITLFVCGNLVILTQKLHVVVVGITLSILFLLVTAAILFLKMPRTKYIFGGGLGLDILLFRITVRKVVRGNKVIFSRTQIEEMSDEDC